MAPAPGVAAPAFLVTVPQGGTSVQGLGLLMAVGYSRAAVTTRVRTVLDEPRPCTRPPCLCPSDPRQHAGASASGQSNKKRPYILQYSMLVCQDITTRPSTTRVY